MEKPSWPRGVGVRVEVFVVLSYSNVMDHFNAKVRQLTLGWLPTKITVSPGKPSAGPYSEAN